MSEPQKNLASKWLEIARWAPSGGNAQPWMVHFEEDERHVAFVLRIDPDYQKISSLMDVEGIASAMALGSFFKNLSITAAQDGAFLLSCRPSQSGSIWNGKAEFIFEKRGARNLSVITIHDLQQRRTDRGEYRTESVPASLLNRIQDVLRNYPQLKYTEIVRKNKFLIRVLSALQKVRWQHAGFLQSLLNEIGFSSSDPHHQQKIPVPQLGVSRFESLFLSWMNQNPKAAAFLMKIGFHTMPVRKGVLTFTNACDRIFFLQAPTFDFKSAFELGACFQEIWLSAEAEKISFQPCGDGLVALAHWHGKQENYQFQPTQIKAIEKATQIFKSQFQLDMHLPVMGFRIGYATSQAPIGIRKTIHAQTQAGLISELSNRA